jgi:hypothetical protein
MTKLRSEKDTAELLGNLSLSTLRHWRVSGEGPPFVKVGRRVMYRDEDLHAFIAKNVRHSTTEAA